MYSLRDDEIRALAPAVYQETAAPTVSKRYAFVSTKAIVEALRGEGWEVSRASQARSRKIENRPFAKHLLRFRRADFQPAKVGDLVGEVILKNAHMANGTYDVWGGAFRLVCLNGLVVGDNLINGIKVRHTHSAVQGVVEATTQIAQQLPEVERYAQAMRERIMSRDEQMGLALRALNLRWADGEAPVTYDQLLHVRRPEDADPTLWQTYNRIQENLVAPAGLTGRINRETGRRRPLRRLTDLRAVEVNRALWNEAQRVLEAA